MGLYLLTPPTDEPVTRDEAINHLRLTDPVGGEVEELDSWVTAAREHVELFTERALVTQTWRLILHSFPAGYRPLRLPRPPLQSVTSISYVDGLGATQVMPSTDYVVDTACTPGRIWLAYEKTWPLTRAQVNAVTVEFKAGYGDVAAVPDSLKSAIKILLGEMHEHRELSLTGTIQTEMPALRRLLAPYRVMEPVPV